MRRFITSPFPDWRSATLLAGAGLLAYLNTFSGAFQFDDYRSIVNDSRLDDLPTFLDHIAGTIRPLLKATLFADRLLWGEDPAGYHLLNLLLHLGSGLFFYAIVAQLADESAPPAMAVPSGFVPFWAAMLFLVHPLGTETVTYLSGRATGLMAFFYLVGLHLYLRAAYTGALACFVLALLSKETAVTFPAVLLLVEVVVRARRGEQPGAALVRVHSRFWGTLLLFLAAAAMHPRYAYLFEYSLGIRPLYENLLTQVNVVAYALTLFFIPARLNFDHDFPAYISVFAWPTPLALVLLPGLVVLAVLRARVQPLFAFGVLWFFLQVLPTNSLLPRYDALSERNLYLPAAGLLLALVSAWSALEGRLRATVREPRWAAAGMALRVLPFAVIAFLIGATLSRNTVYRDAVVLWRDAAQKSPAKSRPRVNLGHAYYLAGDSDRAIEQFRIALALDRDNPAAQENLRAVWQIRSRQGGP
jgi:protein O-mannosyl-transferase